MNSVNLKTIISKQIPNFVQEDHRGLQQFLEAYYEYVNQYVKRDIVSLRDLDNTLDEFVSYIKNELDIFGNSEYDHIDEILLIRKIKEVLVSKGSEAAYKFLFKILYDKPINISYPWDSVLKASDGKWKRDTSLFIRITEGNPVVISEKLKLLVGSRVSIVGQQRTMFVYVDSIRFIEDGVFEFFIEKSYYGEILVGDKLVYEDLRGVILPTTISYEIVNPGEGYKVGDIINGSTFANNKTITQRLKVIGVDANGGITSLVTLRFGYDYLSEFFLLTTNEQSVKKSRFSLYRNGSLQFDLPDSTEVEKYQDYGQVTKPNYWTSATRTVTVSPTAVNISTDTITSTAHGFVTGDIVNYTTAGAGIAIGGLVANGSGALSNYYIIRVNNDSFKLASTSNNARTGLAINLTGAGTVTSHVFSLKPISSLSYTGTLLEQFYTETVNNISNQENFTLIRFKIGAVAKYQGYYYSNDGFLSDSIYLQDSKYYQKYSYLVTVDERVQDYKALLKSFIHPAGVALFGEYQIQNTFNSNLSVGFKLEEFVSRTTIVTINRTLRDDINTLSDDGGYVDMNPYDSQLYILRTPQAADRYNVGNFSEHDSENPTIITINPS
jgi:hypothetical protein